MVISSGVAYAQDVEPISIPSQPLASALYEYGTKTGRQVMFTPDVVTPSITSSAVSAEVDEEVALRQLLAGTGLTFSRRANMFVIQEGGSGPQPASAEGDGADGTVDALIVTAQKREEDIQDVPIAISAFTQETLDQQKIEGGFDLLKAIPNVTFSKNNFTSYNFSIRGIGTKAVSATTDPGVSVSFNNTGLIQNRLFEQEYFDLERVEVLRGPQGTLYGRNATAGVINVISAKPDLNDFDGWVKGEVGNFHTKRVSAMVNVPLVNDKLALRVAGALTDRQGYDFNTATDNAVNGRSLWSARVTLGFEPTERLRGNLIWERFEEDDDRSRTGKQLCHRDDGPAAIGETPILAGTLTGQHVRRALFGQGCKAGSLYDDGAFGTPNGLSYNFVLGALALSQGSEFLGTGIGAFPGDELMQTIIRDQDPYGGMTQSRNLREIASIRDPRYRASADLLELNVDFDLTPELSISSQTMYNEDKTYSFQDYNRFNTVPVFTDTSTLMDAIVTFDPEQGGPSRYRGLAPGGIYCDPQIGCSDTIAGFDIASADGKQFSQELRLQSSFDGPLNFSVGANYTKFETVVDYYIMFNLLTAMSSIGPFNNTVGGVYDPTVCAFSSFLRGFFVPNPGPVSQEDPQSACVYIDPNPLESMNGEGHNYFRSKNPYELESWAAFGELYWNISEDVKLTAGLRYTDDSKHFTPAPSQLLLGPSILGGGTVARGYPEEAPIDQGWQEWTGRLVLDWKPDLAFTDETLVYGSYSRGYKGGGANPPRPGFAGPDDIQALIDAGLLDEDGQQVLENFPTMLPILQLTAVEYGDTFEPEFLNAYQIGTKNTLLGGGLQFNATAFYYSYTDYQVSQIRDRTAVNENFDATAWGLEFEMMFTPSRDLQLIANLGYLDTEIADGETSIDIMNRTQGNPNYTLVKPWMQLPSNCVIPTRVAEYWVANNDNLVQFWEMCGGLGGLFGLFSGERILDPVTEEPYDQANYPELNGGAGLLADLGGNELPNAPHWTANVGAQYGWDILDGWRATVRGDAYWQSQSYHRVYNYEPYDKLHGWWNANLSVWVERPEDGLKIELYAKNILDDTPLTDAFLNSDDTGLTTNVFTLDPRLIGLSIRKEF